jgi:hypothetical protein
MAMKPRYRARNIKTGRVYLPDELARDQVALLPDGSGFWNIHTEHFPQLVPEASTGRVDHDGVEIFEMDFVSVENGLPMLVRWHTANAAFYLVADENKPADRLGRHDASALRVVVEHRPQIILADASALRALEFKGKRES